MTSPFPLEKLKREINPHDLMQLFLSPHDDLYHQAASFSKAPTNFFNINPTLDQTPHHHHKVEKNKSLGDRELFGSSSSSMVDESHGANTVLLCNKREYGFHDDDDDHDNNNGSVKWMSSKMRLMHKMMMMRSNCTENDDDHHNKPLKFTIKFQPSPHDDNTNDTYDINYSSQSGSNSNNVRVCADCNTTTTPLWRSGPRGPKSLCNACGIRRRKARRAMALAANGETSSSSTKIKTSKHKKSPNSNVSSQYKKQCKPPDHHHQSQKKKLCFKNLALSLSENSTLQRVLPQDVEQAAILLMELSCGFIHT